jgi:hypothetical protein
LESDRFETDSELNVCYLKTITLDTWPACVYSSQNQLLQFPEQAPVGKAELCPLDRQTRYVSVSANKTQHSVAEHRAI